MRSRVVRFQVSITIGAVGSTWRPSTTNAAEWFFAAFDRLYRTKGLFCDQASAEKPLGLFLLGDVFGAGAKGQASPLERTGISVGHLPFYPLLTRPNVLMLRDRMAAGYHQAA